MRSLGSGQKNFLFEIGYTAGANFSPGGRLMLTGDPNGSGPALLVRDTGNLAVVRTWKNAQTGSGTSDLEHLIWSPASKLVLGGTRTGRVILNVQTGAIDATMHAPIDPHFKSTGLPEVALLPLAVSGDARLAAIKSLRWREHGAFWPLEKSRAVFRSPVKAAAALAPDGPRP